MHHCKVLLTRPLPSFQRSNVPAEPCRDSSRPFLLGNHDREGVLLLSHTLAVLIFVLALIVSLRLIATPLLWLRFVVRPFLGLQRSLHARRTAVSLHTGSFVGY